MSVFDSITKLLQPSVLESLKGNMAPVKCKIWSESGYEDIELKGVYPFDTFETLKALVAKSRPKEEQRKFMPKYQFIGYEKSDGLLVPLDFLWYEAGTSSATHTKLLPKPSIPLKPVDSFIVPEGETPTIQANARGRNIIEQHFTTLPELYVYSFEDLLNASKIATPMSPSTWYSIFFPYFPYSEVPSEEIYTKDDIGYLNTLFNYLSLRANSLTKINNYLQSGITLPRSSVLGVKQLRLNLSLKPDTKFNGCDMLFYNTEVNYQRPYLRFMPANGFAISRVYVTGILPIPDMDYPDAIKEWSQEVSPSQGQSDFLMIKYLQRSSDNNQYPLYATIAVFQDGTSSLILQPSKNERRLDVNAFRLFASNLKKVTEDLPFNPSEFKLGRSALVFQMNTGFEGREFTAKRLKQRIPFFGVFFQEIQPLQDSLISLRYKAVSNFATEDKIGTFLTQYTTDKVLKGTSTIYDSEMLRRVMDEFQISQTEATEEIGKWKERKDTPAIVNPDENDFTENYNPGIDIHIYGQHPDYFCHVHEVNSYQSFQRIYSLLSLLFVEKDDLFSTSPEAAESLGRLERAVETEEIEEEEKSPIIAVPVSIPRKTGPQIDILEFGDEEEEEEEEPVVEPTVETKAITGTTVPTKTEEKGASTLSSVINPKKWFLDRLQETDSKLFKDRETAYSTKCQANYGFQPAVLTESQFERMKNIYKKEITEGKLFFNEMPIKGDEDPIVPKGALEVSIVKYGSSPDKINWYFCPEYFCLRDKIMLLEKDFASNKDREGLPKPENSCPFCRGTLIDLKNQKPIEGRTVIHRATVMGSTTDRALYIRLLKGDSNPKRPCCYKANPKGKNNLRLEDGDFEHIKSIFLESDKPTIINLDKPLEITAPVKKAEKEPKDYYKPDPQSYEVLKYSVNHPGSIFVKDNVHPLKAGQYGILPAPFDKYFAQNSKTFIGEAKGTGTLRLRSNGAGFARIGVEQGYKDTHIGKEQSLPTESLFAVLAPLDRKSVV